MHPAGSIIVFTTLSGLGFGLIAFLSFGGLAPGDGAIFWASAVAVTLSAVGLTASLGHLGRPERAWRALSQWRTSWLSREGVLSIATLAAFGIFTAGRIFFETAVWPLGWLAGLLSVLTVYATAMIYASLRTVPIWNRPLTPACYIAFSAAGGMLLLALFARLFGQPAGGKEGLALVLLALAWVLKFWWWRSAFDLGYGGSTPETATGLGGIGRVRLFEAPHTSPNYLMREMVCTVGRRHARKLGAIALAAGAALPLVSVMLSLFLGGSAFLLLIAALGYTTGLLAERWLFFAEARHTVALYYGRGEAPGQPGIDRGGFTKVGDEATVR